MHSFFLGTITIEEKKIILQKGIIPYDLFYFDGHFPNHPVLPAVAIIDISVLLLQSAHPTLTLTLQNVFDAKFSQLVQPGASISIEATNSDEDQQMWKIHWKNTEDLSVVAQLSVGVRVQ